MEITLAKEEQIKEKKKSTKNKKKPARVIEARSLFKARQVRDSLMLMFVGIMNTLGEIINSFIIDSATCVNNGCEQGGTLLATNHVSSFHATLNLYKLPEFFSRGLGMMMIFLGSRRKVFLTGGLLQLVWMAFVHRPM
ncbi:hypothetical protein CDAR_168551 [Caerostris darwini]|uniref:Uncharacterized protein n=1 Tax=Caerostris darwini TaxID=1538125 RepID=A0AAV4T2X4_9ARAC|nr:hypothetical protein CDAR_168551 [Caerostris darwini]